MYNIMSCGGFDTSFFGGCGMSWLGLVILFFIVALTRKWIGEEAGIEYNFWIGLSGAFLLDIIVVTITGSFKWALLAGIGGACLGFLGGMMFSGGEESE